MGQPGYTIHGGQTDEDRLARQAGVMAAATMAFLTGVGARPGMACLDLGSGDGQVSIQLARLVGPAGRVVGIDYTPALHAEPPVPALDRLAAIYSATVRARGGDPAIGPRLPAHLTAAGLLDVREHTVVNPMTTEHDKLFLAQLLDNMHAAILDTGSATPDELADVRAAVAAAANRPDTTFFQARMHQVSGRRP